jgi:hypothetical protein
MIFEGIAYAFSQLIQLNQPIQLNQSISINSPAILPNLLKCRSKIKLAATLSLPNAIKLMGKQI